MNNKKPFGFVFDLDTTINNNNLIDDDAIKMLRSITNGKQDIPVMFISKFNYKETEKVVAEIEKRVGKGKMKTIIASNNGAYISNKKVFAKSSLTAKQIKNIKERTEKYAPGSIIIYKTATQNIREEITYVKKFRAKLQKGLTLLMNPVLKKYKKYNIFTKSFSNKLIDFFIRNDDILSIEVVAPKKKIGFLRKKYNYVSDINSGVDETINIAGVTKWDAIKTVFKEHSDNLIYFSNNPTDTDCMLKSNTVIFPKVKNAKLVQDILFLQKSKNKNMFALNGYNHKDLLDYIDNKGDSIARLKYDTKCHYNNLTKKKFPIIMTR